MRKFLIHQKRRILDDFFKIDEALVSFERFDGSMTPPLRRLNLDRGDSVAALVFHREKQKLVLVNQFRYPTAEGGPGWITEIAAGMIGPGHTPEEAIRHELCEELGYAVRELRRVCSFYVSPGGTSERIILFYAEVGESERTGQGGGIATEGEDIATVELTLGEARAGLESGEIVDAKTIIAIQWLLSRTNTST